MNYDMNLIKYHKNVFFRIASVILIVCFTLFGFTACAGTTDSKDNNDDKRGSVPADLYGQHSESQGFLHCYKEHGK